MRRNGPFAGSLTLASFVAYSLHRTNTQNLLISFREQRAGFECSALQGAKGETEEVL